MWKLQSNYFPPRFHVRVPWGMKNVRSTSKKVFFSVCPGDKNSKAYTKLKRFIKIYLSLFHYTLNSKIWKLFTSIQLSATFPTHLKIYKIKLISRGQNRSLNYTQLETFLRHFFSLQLGNVCSSIAVLS